MQLPTMLGWLLAAICVAGHADASADHPIVKVIDLLRDLTVKVKSEGQAEEASFEKFVYWCKTSNAELQDSIQEEKDTIDTLGSTIESKTKETALLIESLKKLEDEIKDLQASDKEASEDDKERNKLYLQKEKDLKSTISAIDEAIKALEEASTTTDAKLLLSQHRLAQNRVRDIFALISLVASATEQNSLIQFVQEDADPSGDYNKHTKKYSFKSNSVTELLKNLKLKFEDELIEATKAETNAQNAHALAKNARDATLKAAQNAAMQTVNDHADADGALTTAKGDLKDQEEDLKADSGTLQATQKSCTMKISEWQERSALRNQELQAMAAAIKILGKVSGVRTEQPSNPVPPSAPVKLIQVSSSSKLAPGPQARAVKLLRATAETYHSKALEHLATEVSAHVPHQFQDVINQIQKMIFRLKQEQTDENNHKAWCDQEISKTETSKSDKTDKISELSAKIEEGNADVVALTSEIEAADKMVAEIKKFQAEATQIRNAGKRENQLAIKDAAEAQRAIANAMSVMTEFYKDSGAITKEPWEFLQEPVKLPKDPALWDSPYTGVADPTKAGTGVIAVLEAVSADFSKMEADTRAQEVTDANEYDDTMKKHAIELARRSKEGEMKGAQKHRLLGKITDMNSQKKHVSDELESTEQYFKDLKPACMTGDSTYEDRKKARDAEIKALGDAQSILNDAYKTKSLFLQKVSIHA
jgi:chromosome segregation ATPase